MNRDEAKNILSLYRPGTADEDDPQIAEALGLAKSDAELAHWLEEHSARQKALRAKFREIAVPEGLKEQIISEQKAAERRRRWQRSALTAAVALVGLLILSALWIPSRPADDTFAIYRSRMISGALRGYSMDLVTNDATAIRAYLAQKMAPADYVLPAPLQRVAVSGCAVQRWHGAKVSMICFRTGQPLPPGQESDMWLFVVDRASVKALPAMTSPEAAPVNRLITAAWVQGGKLYLLGTSGDEQVIRQYL